MDKKEFLFGIFVLIVIVYFFSPYARVQIQSTANQIDLGISGIGTDSISEISNNPENFQGQNVMVQGEIRRPIQDVGYLTRIFIGSEDSRIEVQECGLGQETYSTVKLKGMVRNYSTCNCAGLGRYGWSEIAVTKKEECINDGPGMYEDFRCEEGTEKVRHYISCQNVIEKKE